MQVYAYGEDALTLWAIKNKLGELLMELGDNSNAADCRIFFRPSFGRRGGEASAQFGEFDFILLSKECLYLGESKWQRSSEKIRDGVLTLREEQVHRHTIFAFYVREWAFGSYAHWSAFVEKAQSKLGQAGIAQRLAPDGSLLAENLQTVLGVIRRHYTLVPDIRNVLLYFHKGDTAEHLLQQAPGFDLILVDYSPAILETTGNFIVIEL